MDPNQPRPQPPKPAGLNNILNNDDGPPNGPSRLRDSGFYSTADVSSKHTSAASFNAAGLSPGTSGYQSSADKTPSPVAGHMPPQNILSPSAGHMSVAAMVSPTAPGIHEPRRLEHQSSMESTRSNATIGESYGLGAASRRESVDSRINQGLSDMRLGNSPYASHNQSTTSIQNQLHSQRNPRPGLETPSVHRISNGYAPGAERNPDPKTGRTAPAITGPATGTIARAAEPTKGQAWAFPEDERATQAQQYEASKYDASRRSSITESIASSQFTADSRLPPGQRRLEDGPSPPGHLGIPDYTVHGHMPHRQLDELQALDMGSSSQPYSRTPELRVSHKLAERKRRTEMKELFDALRDEMPQERGSKASKWEILTKAINEHRQHKDLIRQLQTRTHDQALAIDQLRRQLSSCRCEAVNQHYAEAQPPPAPQHAPRHPLPPGSQPPPSYPPGPYANSDRTELPPLRSISGNVPGGPESMTGVQYDPPGTNGYRQERY